MCFRNSARVQICSSFSVPRQAGMPVQRMPCAIFQKEYPSGSSSTPSVASCGGAGIFALCNRRGRSIALRRAVADRTVLAVKVDAGDQIGIGQGDRIGALRSVASQGRIERDAGRPTLEPTRVGVGIGRDEAGAQDGVAAAHGSQDRQHDAEHERSQHHVLREARSISGRRAGAVGRFCSMISARVSHATSSASSPGTPSPDCQWPMTATKV